MSLQHQRTRFLQIIAPLNNNQNVFSMCAPLYEAIQAQRKLQWSLLSLQHSLRGRDISRIQAPEVASDQRQICVRVHYMPRRAPLFQKHTADLSENNSSGQQQRISPAGCVGGSLLSSVCDLMAPSLTAAHNPILSFAFFCFKLEE